MLTALTSRIDSKSDYSIGFSPLQPVTDSRPPTTPFALLTDSRNEASQPAKKGVEKVVGDILGFLGVTVTAGGSGVTVTQEAQSRPQATLYGEPLQRGVSIPTLLIIGGAVALAYIVARKR